jgi:predicted nucleic acid-binding protein
VRFLLDTVVLSETISPAPDSRVLAWLDRQPESDLVTSVLCLGEIRRGVGTLDASSRRRAVLERWFRDGLNDWLAGRALPIDALVALRWGELFARLAREGRTLPLFDSLIAATALERGLTVVTRNVRDFEPASVAVFNPWAP